MGGWNAGSGAFSSMVASTESRLLFVNSAIDFLRKYDFDGLDLDWEYPTRRGGRPEDKENFAKLVKVLFFMMMKLYPEVVSILGMIKQSKSFIQYLWIFGDIFYSCYGRRLTGKLDGQEDRCSCCQLPCQQARNSWTRRMTSSR